MYRIGKNLLYLNYTVLLYIDASCGIAIEQRHLKNCVYTNVSRLLCNEPRDCSANSMFVSRGLPTCKMLIRLV